MNIERKTLPEQHYIYVDRVSSLSGAEIGAAMASGFGEVFAFAMQNGVKPLAMPMSIYLQMPSDNKMAFRAAVLVSAEDAKRAAGQVKAGVMPAGEVYMTTHVGSYASLNQTHKAMWDEMTAQGISKTMPVWEIYIDDPQTTPEDKLRTEIYRAVGS
ncbi:MAG: GyrI-like domain-containing protein [Hyphomonadaceae bacterium]